MSSYLCRQPKELLFQQFKYLFYEDILRVCEANPTIKKWYTTDSMFVDLIQLKKRVVYEITCYRFSFFEFTKGITMKLHTYGEVSFTVTFEFEVGDMQRLIQNIQSYLHVQDYRETICFTQNRETQQTLVLVENKETLTMPTNDLIRVLRWCDEVPDDHQRIIYGDHHYRDLPIYKEEEPRDIMD
jgi:hypothetical protein